MQPFDVTIAFRQNIGRRHGPVIWQESKRVERVFASSIAEALHIGEARTGGRAIACKCLWDR
jgi:hypothetical protein